MSETQTGVRAGWKPGDVVRCSDGHLYALMAADVVNPWACLTEDRDGEEFVTEDDVRAMSPIDVWWSS